MEFLRAHDPGSAASQTVRALSVAAEQFCADACARPASLAGFPHPGLHVRDCRSHYLAGSTWRVVASKRAKRALRTVALSADMSAFLPALIAERPRGRRRPSADATLWLLFAARESSSNAPARATLSWRSNLYPALAAPSCACGQTAALGLGDAEGLLAQGRERRGA